MLRRYAMIRHAKRQPLFRLLHGHYAFDDAMPYSIRFFFSPLIFAVIIAIITPAAPPDVFSVVYAFSLPLIHVSILFLRLFFLPFSYAAAYLRFRLCTCHDADSRHAA